MHKLHKFFFGENILRSERARVVSIPGPHEGRGQNTNPECQLESRVSTGITSGDESAQRATSDASWYEGFELIRGARIAPVPNKGSRYRHYYFCKPILLCSKISRKKSQYWYSNVSLRGNGKWASNWLGKAKRHIEVCKAPFSISI